MKTKLYLLVAAGVLISVATFGQTKFGVHAGLNLSNEKVKASALTIAATAKIGLNVGASAEFNISDGFAVQTELNFSQMGAKVGDLKETLNFIAVPVLAKIKVGGLGIYAGPQIGFLLSANQKLYGQTENIISDLKRIDFSAIGGAEYTFAEKFVVSARYQLGLLNTYSDTYSSVAKLVNNGANLTLGYKF
jgi:opacity protein-like surface antigen